MTLPREVALMLQQATSLPDKSVFLDRTVPLNTVVDYYRVACHVLFVCERCGTCCTTGDPIRLRQDDIERIARHLKIPLGKAVKKYTMPDPDRPGIRRGGSFRVRRRNSEGELCAPKATVQRLGISSYP